MEGLKGQGEAQLLTARAAESFNGRLRNSWERLCDSQLRLATATHTFGSPLK